MPTLLQITSEVNSGSVGRIAEQIGEVAIEKGWNSYITYARNNLPSASKVIKIGTYKDIYLHVLQTRVLDNHGFGSYNATKDLINKIIEIDPDIIHLHHLHGYFIHIELLFDYLVKSNKPIVWTFHDCWSFTGHCTHFEYVGCNKWKDGCYNCEQTAEYPKSLVFDRSKKNYSEKKQIFNALTKLVIVPVSNWLGAVIKDSFLKDYPIEVIQNGIDLNVFRPLKDHHAIKERYRIYKPFVILGVASNWEAKKGKQYFIALANLISADCVIVLVGLSKNQITKLPAQIIGIERTENLNDLVSLYSLADVFVNPTLEDSFPTTNLEALACGTPVVTFATGGSVEAISDDTGLITPKDDVPALLNAIERIKSNTKQFYSDNCRRRARDLYDKNLKFQAYFKLYQRLLGTS